MTDDKALKDQHACAAAGAAAAMLDRSRSATGTLALLWSLHLADTNLVIHEIVGERFNS